MLLLLKVHKVSTDLTGEGHQDKAEEGGEGKKEGRNETFDDGINPTLPLFYLPLTSTQHAHSHHAHLQYSQKVISLKSAHIALSVIKMNC